MSSLSSAVASGNRVALAHAAASSAAVLRRHLSPARQQPARASVSRCCLSAGSSMKNTRLANRSGNHCIAMVLNPMLAPAGAFGGGSNGTAVSSSGRGNPCGCRAVFLTPGAVSRRLTFARAHLPVPSDSSSPNPALNRTLRDKAAQRRLALRWAALTTALTYQK